LRWRFPNKERLKSRPFPFSQHLSPLHFLQCEDFGPNDNSETGLTRSDDKYFPITNPAIPEAQCSPPALLQSVQFYQIIVRGSRSVCSQMLRLLSRFHQFNLLSTNRNNLKFRYLPNLASSLSSVSMSPLQHTGPSTFYTELAELPLPVSANFVAGDGASINLIGDHRFTDGICPPLSCPCHLCSSRSRA
jgi:hypothetical protein